MMAASSSPRSDSLAATASSISIRSSTGVVAQPRKAWVAAATARPHQRESPAGMRAISCSVWIDHRQGFSTVGRYPLPADVHAVVDRHRDRRCRDSPQALTVDRLRAGDIRRGAVRQRHRRDHQLLLAVGIHRRRRCKRRGVVHSPEVFATEVCGSLPSRQLLICAHREERQAPARNGTFCTALMNASRSSPPRQRSAIDLNE